MPNPTRVILITGAASGIGAATARHFAAPGTAILIHTRRNQAGAESVADAVCAKGGIAQVYLADLTEPDAAHRTVAAAAEKFGGLDVLISNAGFADRTPLSGLSPTAMARSHEAIAGAFFRLAQAAVPHLKARKDARIVAISSFVAHVFRTNLSTFPASSAAKAALEAMVRALAIELGPDNITVNAVAPGFIRKDAGAHRAVDVSAQSAHIPLGRIGEPEDIAATIAFLASPAAAYITGQCLHVDGGLVMR